MADEIRTAVWACLDAYCTGSQVLNRLGSVLGVEEPYEAQRSGEELGERLGVPAFRSGLPSRVLPDGQEKTVRVRGRPEERNPFAADVDEEGSGVVAEVEPKRARRELVEAREVAEQLLCELVG